MQKVLAAPILLYGEVVDQDGSPVADAEVLYTSDNRTASQTGPASATLLSDRDGHFTVSGITGAQLAVVVSKNGYSIVSDFGEGRGSSSRRFEFGLADDKGRPYMNPAARQRFVLARKGLLEPLIYCTPRWQPLQANQGKLRMFIGPTDNDHAVDFSLEIEKDAQPLGGGKTPYAWTVTLRPVAGRASERKDHGFTAPAEGYRDEIAVGYTVPPADGEWRAVRPRQDFYIHFDDGTYARILFDLVSDAGEKTLYFQAWYNPANGSRQIAPGMEKPVRRSGVKP